MPITAIHPGEHLAEELETLNLSAAELARQLKVPSPKSPVMSGPEDGRLTQKDGETTRCISLELLLLTSESMSSSLVP